MRAIGIDPSTSATGIVVLDASASGPPTLVSEDTILPGKLLGMDRARHIVTCIMEAIELAAPDRIVVEGYSLNMKNASSVVPLVELGGLLRFMMYLDGLKWLDPRATELKKFVIGNGNGNKDQVQMWVLKRWGHTSKNNNTADAYGLACMGLAHANKLSSVTLAMRSQVGSLKMRSG